MQKLTTEVQEVADALDTDPSDANKPEAAVTAQIDFQQVMRATLEAEVPRARGPGPKTGSTCSKPSQSVYKPNDTGHSRGGGVPKQL